MDAIVLAGALNDGPLRASSSSLYEAGIEIAGRPMVDRVVKALISVEQLKRITVVIPEGILSEDVKERVWRVVPPGNTMMDSLRNAFNVMNPTEPVLVVTSDIPLITSEALMDFLERCQQRPADIYYSFVPREISEKKYPGVHRTYVHLKDGVFTGGNIIVIHPRVVSEHSRRIAQAVALRKKPIQLCRLLGFRFVIKLLFGQLTVSEIEHRVEKILHLRAAGIVSPFPEVGIDVDKPSDLDLARKSLA